MTIILGVVACLTLLGFGFMIGFSAGKQAASELIFRRFAAEFPKEFQIFIRAAGRKGIRKG